MLRRRPVIIICLKGSASGVGDSRVQTGVTIFVATEGLEHLLELGHAGQFPCLTCDGGRMGSCSAGAVGRGPVHIAVFGQRQCQTIEVRLIHIGNHGRSRLACRRRSGDRRVDAAVGADDLAQVVSRTGD